MVNQRKASKWIKLGIFRIVRDRKFTWVGWCLKARGAGFLDRLVKIRQHFGIRRKGQLRLVRPQDERDQSKTKEKVGSCNCPHTHTEKSHRPRHNFCRSQRLLFSPRKSIPILAENNWALNKMPHRGEFLAQEYRYRVHPHPNNN